MKYSEEKIDRAMTMELVEDKDHSTSEKFLCYHVKAKTDKDAYKYKLLIDEKTGAIACGCWWYINRAKRHAVTYGLCSHQLGYLWNFKRNKFWEEISKDG